MRIIYHSDTFLPQINGVTTSLVNFSKELEKRGHQILILTTERSEEKHNLGKNISVKYFKATDKLTNYPDFPISFPNVRRTWKAVNDFNPQIIHSHTPSPQAWTLLFIAREKKLPYVATYHTILPDFTKHTALAKLDFAEFPQKLTWFYSKIFYERADLVISPSEAIKRVLRENGINNRIEAVSNGINTVKFCPGQSKPGRGIVKILHLGRVSYEKNIDTLIKAVKILKEKGLEFSFTIVGGGPDSDKLQELSASLGLAGQIEFRGPIPHDKIEEQYREHDIFATASTIETEGLVVVEAMACGLPVVAVDSLALPEIVKNGENGFIAKPGDEHGIAGYLEKLITDPGLRSSCSKRSMEISSSYALPRSIDRIEKLYLELLQMQKPDR